VLQVRAEHGWAVLGAGVLVYEVLCAENEMLSHGFDRLIAKHPFWPRILVFLVAGHVANAIPAKYDPVSRIFDVLRLPELLRQKGGANVA
jgi:hypothetical protein